MNEAVLDYNWGKDRNKRNQLILKMSERGDNQQTISTLLKVSQGTVSNVLNGKSKTNKKVYPTLNIEIPSESNFSDVDTIFDDISIYSNMVISGYKKSLLITGMSGMGKTYTVQNELKKANLTKNKDYGYVKGKISPQGLYTILYQNRNRLVIFDDSDSVWDSQDSLNILKHALDSKNPLYNANDEDCTEEPTIPNHFDYNGSIIFISNKFKEDLDPAFLTRTLKVDLRLTLEDTLKRIEYLLPVIGKSNIPIESKMCALDCMKELIEEYGISKLDISLRSYSDVLDMMLHGSVNWKRLALQQCLK
jgi:hypothetical protein